MMFDKLPSLPIGSLIIIDRLTSKGGCLGLPTGHVGLTCLANNPAKKQAGMGMIDVTGRGVGMRTWGQFVKRGLF
jgi:hypothetical protein